MRIRAFGVILVALSWVIAVVPPAVAKPAPGPKTLTIGVDSPDPANQQPDAGRVFEYTDFFTRDVRIHSGDTLDFRAAPASFHIVSLAKSEKVTRKGEFSVLTSALVERSVGASFTSRLQSRRRPGHRRF